MNFNFVGPCQTCWWLQHCILWFIQTFDHFCHVILLYFIWLKWKINWNPIYVDDWHFHNSQFAPCTQRMNECCSELITSRTFNLIEQKKSKSCKTIAGEHKTNPNNNNRAFWRLAEVKWSAMYVDWNIWRNSQWKHFSFEMSNHVTLDFRANIQNSWMCWKVLDHWCNEFHFGPPWTFAFTFCLKSLLNKDQMKAFL